MAATASPPSLLRSRNGRTLTQCPMCGQPLLDHDAIERVEHARRDLEHEIESTIETRATELAKQVAKRERDAAAKKITELTAQVAAHKDNVAELKRAHTDELAKQKQTHTAELRKLRASVRAEVASEAEQAAVSKVQRELRQKDRLINSLKEENETQQRRIEHLTADERGEMNEEELVSRLHVAFPEDKVERLGRGRAGSDILHEVRFNLDGTTEVAGLIVYECKDTLAWNNSFIAQAKKARLTHHTPHVVIVSRAFPRSLKDLCVRDGIPVVSPARLVELARILREMVIELHRVGLTAEGQAAKTDELYKYLSSAEFRAAFDVVVKTADELTNILSSERTAHERTWARRQQVYTELGGKAAAIDGRLRAIIERSDGRRRKGKVVPLARRPAS